MSNIVTFPEAVNHRVDHVTVHSLMTHPGLHLTLYAGDPEDGVMWIYVEEKDQPSLIYFWPEDMNLVFLEMATSEPIKLTDEQIKKIIRNHFWYQNEVHQVATMDIGGKR